MSDELWQAFIQVTGAINALLLGAILVFSPRLYRTRARHKLGAALLAYGYLLLSFTAVDNLWIPTTPWIVLSDYVIVLLAAALFIDYMSSALGRGPVSRIFYLPALLLVPVALLLGTDFIMGPAINTVVLTQVVYTCLTTYIYLKSSTQLVSRVYHLRALIIGLWILHVFQFTRMLLPDVGWIFDLVPLAGAILVLTFTVLVLTDSRSLLALSKVATPRAAPSIALDDIDRYMDAEQPHLDPHLKLDDLAKAAGLPPNELSRLLGSSADGSYYSYVNSHRVREARRLLADPSEARTSIEAIGLMSGFRSRSTFYDAFRRETGMTPAQYRNDLARASE